MVLKFLSLNTKGLNSPYKRRVLWKEADNHHWWRSMCAGNSLSVCKASQLYSQALPSHLSANYKKKKRGVLVAIRVSISFKLHASLMDKEGRYVILVAELNGALYTLVNIYAPNKHQIKFIRRTLAKARSIQKGQLLVCGDFNIPMWPGIDTTSQRRNQDSSNSFCKKIYMTRGDIIIPQKETIPFSLIPITYTQELNALLQTELFSSRLAGQLYTILHGLTMPLSHWTFQRDTQVNINHCGEIILIYCLTLNM